MEKQCRLIVESGSAVVPGTATAERCKPHYRNGVLEAAEISTANELTWQKFLSRTAAYLEVDGTLYAITDEIAKMEDAETAFVHLAAVGQ
jgi:hypothetical protein